MRKILLLITFIILMFMRSQAQRWERTIHISAGTAEYAGQDAAAGTPVYLFGNDARSFSQAPAKKGLLITAGGDLESVGKKGFLIGAGLYYEHASSRQSVNAIVNPLSSTISSNNATGEVSVRRQYISLQPHLGYRISLPGIKLDLGAGLEYAPWISSHEKGTATRTTDNKTFTIDFKPERPKPEFRYAFRSTFFVKKTGVRIEYAKALNNVYEGYIGSNPKAFAQYLRVGIVQKF